MKLTLFLSLFSLYTFAKAPHQHKAGGEFCHGVFPENLARIPVGVKGAGGLEMNKTQALVDQFNSLYADDIKSRGGNLVINFQWENPKVNADAKRIGADYVINLYGGMVRYPEMNEDTISLILCHEIGHLIGGNPTTSRNGQYSTEGQADYFSTLDCFRRFVPRTLNVGREVPSNFKTRCESSFVNVLDQQICVRAGLAGVLLMKVAASTGASLGGVPDLTAADDTVVDRTNFGYPNLQCRLDTIVEGALCIDPHLCERPSCWYRSEGI